MATAVVTSFASNPLTTPFTRPDICSGIHRSGFLSVVDIDTTCLPDGFDPEPTAYFSPGLECPAGYVSACHDHTGVESITTVTCCPVVEDVTLSCVTASTLKDEWEDLFCTWIAPKDGTELPITLSDDGVTSTDKVGFESPGGLNAYGVRMVYQSSDLESTTKTKTADTPADTAEDSSIEDTEEGDEGGGLSTGAKIAIGVCVPVGVIAIAAAAFLLMRRRRKNKVANGAIEVPGSTPPPAAAMGGGMAQRGAPTEEAKTPPVWGGAIPPPAPPAQEPTPPSAWGGEMSSVPPSRESRSPPVWGGEAMPPGPPPQELDGSPRPPAELWGDGPR